MPLVFSSKGSGNSKRVSPGSHFAVCDMVIFLGMQEVGGMFPKLAQQIYVRYEIPAERWSYEKDGKQMEGPAVIGRTFTASMHKKAALRKGLESWSGKTFTEDEASAFDVATILGKACMLTVTESESGGNIYSNISGMSSLPKGSASVKAELPLRYYAPDDMTCFESLPEWIRDKIKAQKLNRSEQPPADFDQSVPTDAYNDAFFTDDDIPF